MKGRYYRIPTDCHRISLCTIEAGSASEVLLPRLRPATILQKFAKILNGRTRHECETEQPNSLAQRPEFTGGGDNKMVGIAEQYQCILRDESIHLNFGINVMHVRTHGPQEEEFLRDPRHRILEWRRVELGVNGG